jgi:hypothetical protein
MWTPFKKGTDISGLAAAMTRIRSTAYASTGKFIAGVNESNWPSALQPVAPVGPPGSQVLFRPLQMGQNLQITPRWDSRYSAAALQRLARYPLARICIENQKDNICSLEFKIQSTRKEGEPNEDHSKRDLKDKNIGMLRDIIADWWQRDMRSLLEDMFVLDAPATYLRRNGAGKISELRWVPGADIVVKVDDQGLVPMDGESVAYQQNWYGMPRINFTSNDLFYSPRNIVPDCEDKSRASYFYGCSPTEQAAPWIETGMMRLEFVMRYYKDGSIPDAMQIVPPGIAPDTKSEAEEVINATLAGELGARRKFKLVQGFTEGGKDQFIFPKEKLLTDIFDELHIRQVAFAYGTSAQRLLKAMNRASAVAGQDAAEEEGTKPIVTWLKSYIDCIIQQKMGLRGYECIFDQSRENDPEIQSKIDDTYVNDGSMTRNEVRVARGMDRSSEPNADKLGIKVAAGVVFLDGSSLGATSPEPAASGAKPNPDDAIPVPPKVGKPAAKLAKGSRPTINPRRVTKASRDAVDEITKAIHNIFVKHAGTLAGAVEKHYKKMVKVDDGKQEITKVLNVLDWSSLPDEVQAELLSAGVSGVDAGFTQLNVDDSGLINKANTIAGDYAQKRGAEMVGMKWVDGELVQNPDAEWAISDTTRDKIQSLIDKAFKDETKWSDLIDQIKESDAFSQSRAAMIAKTEVANAQVLGNLTAWKETGLVEEVDWVLAGNHEDEPDDECDDMAEGGPYAMDDLPEYPQHPQCMCLLVASQIKDDSE